jgi:hypothetical protein
MGRFAIMNFATSVVQVGNLGLANAPNIHEKFIELLE